MRIRTHARELALQFLFQLDFHGEGYLFELEAFLDENLRDRSGEDEAKRYARSLVEGVYERRDELDKVLASAASNWSVARMAAVDRNALRIGCYEMLFDESIPTRVAINEAINLGKKFSSEASGAFINGILDRIRKDRGLS